MASFCFHEHQTKKLTQGHHTVTYLRNIEIMKSISMFLILKEPADSLATAVTTYRNEADLFEKTNN